MKQKPPRWVQITAAVLRRYLALDMAVYAGSATLFLLTASFPLLMWVLMLVNLVPGFSVEGASDSFSQPTILTSCWRTSCRRSPRYRLPSSAFCKI